jgi:hypothetical protein
MTVVVVCLAAACDDRISTRAARWVGSSARLVPTGTTILDETDSTYTGKISAVLVGSDGRFFISDLFAKQILVFSRDGRFIRTFGGRGDAGGKLRSPTWMTLDEDSILYVADAGGMSVRSYDVASGAWLGVHNFTSRTSQLEVWRGNLVAGMIDRRRRASVVIANGERGNWVNLGPHPEMFTLNNGLTAELVGSVGVAIRNDTLITAYQVSDYLYLTPINGGPIDSLYIPVLHRRGARLDLYRQITDDPKTAEDAVYRSSWPALLEVLPSGLLALVFLDADVTSSRVQGWNYLSLVDIGGRRVCPDALIPGPVDPVARVGFRGDTLVVASKEINHDGMPLTIARSYRIDVATCSWFEQQD